MITPERRRMLIIVLPLLALSVVFTGAVIAQDILPGTRQFGFTTEIDAVPQLQIRTGRTGVDLELRDGGGGRIRVEASAEYSGQQPSVSAQGDLIEVECPAPGPYDCDMELVVEVPPGTAVDATNRGGRIEAFGLTGAVDLTTRGGRIMVTDSSGPIAVETESGRILVEDATAPEVTATSRTGEITLRLLEPRRVSATTGVGTVVIDVGACQPYAVDTEASGDETVTIPVDPAAERSVVARSRNGDVIVDCR